MKFEEFIKSKKHLKCSSCKEYGRDTFVWSLKDKKMWEEDPEYDDYNNRKLCDPCWNGMMYYGQRGDM